MRTISIQADKALDRIMEEWLAHLIRAIPVGLDGINFDGGKRGGVVVNQRDRGRWTVSFRNIPGGDHQDYSNPDVMARIIIARKHEG
jgi:hypothetical protein